MINVKMKCKIDSKQKRKLVADTFRELLNKGYKPGEASMFITRHAKNKCNIKILKEIYHEAKKERRVY